MSITRESELEMSTATTNPGFHPTAVRLIGWILFGIVIWFVGRALIEASHDVDWSTLWPQPRWISAGLFLYVFSLVLVDVVVRHLYRHLGAKLSAPRGFILYMVPTLGRYIPGKMLSLAGHVIIARRYGVDFSIAAAAIALLTVIGLTAATLAGFLFLLVQPPGIVDEQLLRWVLVTGIVLTAAALLPGLWVHLVNTALRLFRQAPLASLVGCCDTRRRYRHRLDDYVACAGASADGGHSTGRCIEHGRARGATRARAQDGEHDDRLR